MSTRSSVRNIFPPLNNPELTIRRRSRTDPTLLNNSEMAAEGNGDLPETNFGLKNDMIQQVQNSCQLHGPPGDDANKHLDKFLHVTQSIKGNGVTDDALHLNEITNFCQRLDESLFEAWERYKISIDRCPNHNMFPVTLIDTFYNGLTLRHRDTINAAAGGTFMKRRPEECYDLIENMTAHHNDWDTSAQWSESSSSITSSFDTEIAALKAKIVEINKNLMRVLQVNQQVKAVTPNCEICGGPHSFNDYPATVGNTQNVYVAGAYQAYQAPAYQALVYQDPVHQPLIPQQVVTINKFTNLMKANNAILKNMQTNMTSLTNSNIELKNMFGQFLKMNTASSSGSGTLPGNTITNPKEDLTGITARSGTAYQGPMIPTTTSSFPVVERETKFGPSIKSLLNNKDKLYKLARTPLDEHCWAILLKKLPEKLADPGKFLIPCDFPRMTECLTLTDLSASINLMPLFVWNKLSVPELSPTCMTLELTDRSISCPVGVVEDVFVKVGTFHFSADFVVVDFDADPRVPLILGRYFLKTRRDLINVFEGELTLRVSKEAITFNLDQTSRYSANYNEMTANRIDVIDMACEEYSQEVLSFSNVNVSGNPTPYYDPIVSTTSLTLTSFGNSDFLLEEVDAFLALEDDSTSPKADQSYVDTEGDILLLEAFLNDDLSLPPLNQGNYLPEVRKELKICEAKTDKSSIDEPPEVELKDLPPHLKYAFMESDDKFLVIIAKDLSIEEKTALISVLKSHKRAIAWKLSDIKGIDPKFCTDKILMEEDFEPTVQHQRRVNPKIHDVIKNEVLKLLDAGLICPISDSPWVSPVHCVPKKGGFTVVENEETIEVFIRLSKLTEALILIAPDWDMPFELMCDASDFVIGAVLGQSQHKNFRLIHYASKTMTEAESNYTITEKEMLAVVYAFEKFWSYLIMNKSIVYTDHSALKYPFAKKDSKARLLCWVLLLQEFTFKLIDTKGADVVFLPY
uniref:Reverse transcriptase domain-containing protein n=1 Tax=Tanacetum cinerariifolium TaxID=118510 RepID=A0A6L2MEA8_TANCI|nr:reverse transcriptase domain-containing protein [Tanacetum cinerariifolium]